MLFHKKDSKGVLPELPPLPDSLPRFRGPLVDNLDKEDSVHSLPTFPDSPRHNTFSQAAIKDAISQGDEDEMSVIGQPAQRAELVEMDEWAPSTRNSFSSANLPSPPSQPRSGMQSPSDIFVKIDKFHVAKKSLAEARVQLEEIDDLMKKVRETKMREEQELLQWERDLSQIKSRIRDVSENIFEKAG